MSDLIERQAAIDALRYAQHRFTVADEAGGMGTVKWSENVIYSAAAERVLTELPSAQPKVIHCKDCEWWTKQDKSIQGRCELMQMYPTGEWFCGNAQKKEGEK